MAVIDKLLTYLDTKTIGNMILAKDKNMLLTYRDDKAPTNMLLFDELDTEQISDGVPIYSREYLVTVRNVKKEDAETNAYSFSDLLTSTRVIAAGCSAILAASPAFQGYDEKKKAYVYSLNLKLRGTI